MTIQTKQIWEWLADVPDPEIPVISIVDLGIVREVTMRDGICEVTITPTYSGCPAMLVISESVINTLRNRGVQAVLKMQISPAWTTDWMSESGKQKLKAYGIAPPQFQAIDISRLTTRSRDQVQPKVPCPRCHAQATVCISQFGSTPCKALYRCQSCLETFDYFKCH